jgi:hypothetical protein
MDEKMNVSTKNIKTHTKKSGIMTTNLNGLQFLSNSGLNQTYMAMIYTAK